jgi:hypothetical protein
MVFLAPRIGLDLCNIPFAQFQFHFIPFSGLPQVDLSVYLSPIKTTYAAG